MRSVARRVSSVRILGGLADLLSARPRLVLAVCLSLAALAATRALRLEITTSRTNLGHASTPAEAAFGGFLAEFGTPNDLIAVVDSPGGTTTEELRRTSDDLAATLARDTAHVRSTFHRVDLDYFLQRLLLFTPLDELEQIRRVLGSRFVDKLRAGQVGGIDQLVQEFNAAFSGRPAADLDPRRATAALDALALIAREVDARLQDPARKGLGGFRELVPPLRAGAIDERGYLQSRDGELRVVFVRPAVRSDENAVVLPLVRAVRAVAAEVAARHPGLRVRVTGLPALQADETEIVDRDTSMTTLISLVAIAAVLLYGYRRPGQMLLSLLSLGVGVSWTLAWVQLQFGQVNLVASAFAPILLGRGSDFDVYLIARYNAARAEGLPPREAVRESLVASGGMVTGGLVTTLAFLVAAVGQFGVFYQLGMVVGVGLTMVLIASLLVTPTLLLLFGDRRLPGEARAQRALAEIPPFGAGPGAVALRQPGWVVGAAFAVLAVLGLLASRLEFDYDLVKLLPPGAESVAAQADLSRTSDYGTDVVVVTTANVDEARDQAARLAALPQVARVESIASFLPADQAPKLERIRALRPLVEPIPPFAAPAPPTSARAFARALDELGDSIDDALFLAEKSDLPVAAPLRRLRDGVNGVLATLRALRAPEAERRVAGIEGELFALLVDARAVLRQNVLAARPVSLDDLPAATRERFLGNGGKTAIYVFPSAPGAGEPLAAFVAAVRSIAPDATGFPVIYHDSSRSIFRGLLRSSALAFLVIVAAILVHFRELRATLLTLVPLVVAVVAMGGLTKWFGVPHNIANIVALPLLIGLGTDYGLQLVHHARLFPEASLDEVLRKTGLAVFLAGGTTAAGFGALGLARHLGARSLGLELLLGTLAAMAGALIVLPAALALEARRSARRSAPPVPPSSAVGG